MLRVTDGGPAGSGLDAFSTYADPGTCADDPAVAGRTLYEGDAVVSDGIIPPRRLRQCRHGGWRAFGFASLADCLAYVRAHRR